MSHTAHPRRSARLSSSVVFRVLFWFSITVAFFYFIGLIQTILLPFVIGILTAYFLDPVTGWLRKKGCSRTSAAAFITISFFIFATLLLILVVPNLMHQIGTFLDELPHFIASFQQRYGSMLEKYVARISQEQATAMHDAMTSVGGDVVNWGSTVLKGLVQSGIAFANFISLLFLTPIVVFYLLRDWEPIVDTIDTLLPRDYAPVIREQITAMDQTLAGFIRGQMNVCLLMGTYFGIALTIVGVKFGLVIGFVSGLLIFLPFIGISIGFVFCILIALFQFDTLTPFITITLIYVLGMAVEGNFITPRLVGDKVGLHPLWIIFGMLAGGALFGFVGILISLPVTAILGVLVRFAIAQYLKSPLYTGQQSSSASDGVIITRE